ncbi:MAG: hypothetical protein H6718_05860 [Polyangiaceae bacterium]|nr:hypothetical protein [Myxococcales bacterium]MCB9584901.1 hypothetical protein [Polyangiaceae bacterium]MCB9607526.1 hypothetical protein [Polyangiaceae bacterium]
MRPNQLKTRLSKLAVSGSILTLGGLTGCRGEAPPGAKAEPAAVHLEVRVENSQAAIERLSAAEAAKPLPRKLQKAEAAKSPEKKPPKLAQRDPSPPTEKAAPTDGDEKQAVAALEASRGTDDSPAAEHTQKSPLVPVGFSLGQDSDGSNAQTDSVIPQLLDAQGELLPQTKDLPGTDSAFFKRLGPTLFKAIVDNNPELVLPYFMPLAVYEKLKESKNPPRDWKFRLFGQLKRDIEKYHRALGRNRERAHFVALDVVPEDALWMKAGREYNKLEYYRLFGSSLRYVDQRGRERRFDVSALFSWRGEWYIVHLHGLK